MGFKASIAEVEGEKAENTYEEAFQTGWRRV